MLALVVIELLPDAVSSGGWRRSAAGVAAGAALMLALSLALGVG